MKHWQQLVSASCTAALLVAAPLVSVHAEEPGRWALESEGRHNSGDRQEMRGRMFERMAEALELNDGQKDQLKEHFKARHEDKLVQRKNMRALRESMGTAIRNGEGEQEIERIAQQIGELAALKAMEHYHDYQALSTILDRDQLEKMDALRRQKGERFRSRHGGFKGKHRNKQMPEDV